MGLYRRMDGKRMHGEVVEEIKKGPWKPEEDEVLINHVNKYGPRDWSSLRSKGLLQRLGKACRLRWVNKLRPNLKNGVKFSAEEERIVIDLQSQIGNRWARIATYLSGRTDNDVKNFWSSRQKKLSRILKKPTTPSIIHSKSHNKHFVESASSSLEIRIVEAPKLSPSTEGGGESSSRSQSCSSSFFEYSIIANKMMALPECPEPLNSESYFPELSTVQPEFTPMEKKPLRESPPELCFPHFPQLQSDLQHSLESQGCFATCFAVDTALQPPPLYSPCFVAETSYRSGCMTPADSFIYDFPVETFDLIEPLPSSLNW